MKLLNVNPDILFVHQSLNRNDWYYLSRENLKDQLLFQEDVTTLWIV